MLTETPGEEANSRAAVLETALQAARAEIEQLQEGSLAAREESAGTVQSLRAELDSEREGHARSIADLEARLVEATADRDNALAEVNRRQVADHLGALTAPLRPDVRRTVEEQLASCATADEVTARWDQLLPVLEGAGLLAHDPAGAGLVSLEGQASGSRPRLTPHQQIQRQLLGLA
jgi:hypothetical protein